MSTDRYGLLLSTTSSAAHDAYMEGCEAKLTMYPGAIEAFDRAIAADPRFALAHAARAHALLERGDAAAARASTAAANSSPPVCPPGKPAISHFSTCLWRVSLKLRLPRCSPT
jgi:tetratricopeptide (TPR) repeat protein